MDTLANKPLLKLSIIESNEPVLKLALIVSLLDLFHEYGIMYCHWKSNEHLGASMTGDTDLDILFDDQQKEALVLLLNKLGFRKFSSIKQKQYKDIEDFIGLDIQSGKVVHLHAHFRLTMGEIYLKGFQLDFEERILNSRVFDKTFDIYRIDPAFELILLYFREALKLRHRDIIMMYLLKKIHYTGNILSEYKWLKQQSTESQVEEILKNLFKNHRPVYELVIGEFNRKELLKLSVLLRKEFSPNRLYSPSAALLLRWYREVVVLLSRKMSRFLKQPIISQRFNPRGGIIIAVIGADGSGKSTVIANLQATFRQKLDVYKIYFGRGDGRISWGRKMLIRFKKMMVPTQKKIQKNSEHDIFWRKKGLIADVYRCIEALLVAHEKRSNINLMHAAKKRGMMIICDRYPQNQVMGYNDGPLLHYLSESGNPVFRAISRMESRMYALAENSPPDVLFKLIADAKVVEARKPGETSLEMLEAKISGIKKLKFVEKCKVITVDATQPLEKVLTTIKKEIWDAYP